MALTQYAIDDCQRANENPLSDGGMWTNAAAGGLKLLSNNITQISGTDGKAIFTGISWPNDQYSEAVLGTAPVSGNGFIVLIVRAFDATMGNSIQGLIPTPLGSTQTAFIRKQIQGTLTTLASAAATANLGDTWRLSAVGDVVTLSQNGTPVITHTAVKPYPAEGIPGVELFHDSSGAVNITSWAGGAQPDALVRQTLASDNFNRADGALGSNWTELGSAAGSIVIASNVCVENSGGDSEFYNAISWPNDCWSQVTIPTKAATTTNYAGPMVRGNTPGSDNDYRCFNFSGNIYIQKRLNGALSSNLTNAAWTPVNGDIIRLEVSGTALKVFVNNVLVLAASDAGIATGNSGFQVEGSSTSSPTADNWSGGIYVLPNIANALMMMGAGT
jgi:hypothetical protein